MPSVIAFVGDGNVGLFSPTVSTGLRETVTYRNVSRFFPIFLLETVRAPPLRATETAVT